MRKVDEFGFWIQMNEWKTLVIKSPSPNYATIPNYEIFTSSWTLIDEVSRKIPCIASTLRTCLTDCNFVD